MTLPSLLPLAGAVMAPALERLIDGVSERLTFLDVLHKQEQADQPQTVDAAESSTLQRDFAELSDRLRQRFAELGIDLTTPLRLKQDGRERVVVDGDHPNRVLIESIFGNDEELTKLFREVARAATSDRGEPDSVITREFRLVVSQSDAAMEFV